MSYKVKPLVLGTIAGDKSGFTHMCFPGQPIKLEVVSFLITGAEKNILVDTASYAEMMKRFWPGQGIDFCTMEEALEKEGLTPDDIDIIIITHMHHDHIGYNYLFKNAEFIVQKAEYEYAFNPHPIQAMYYPKALIEGWEATLVEGDVEIYPGIDILFTPGHTPGTQSVSVDTKDGKVVIAGFCSLDYTFDKPADVLPQGHPFANWEVFSPNIATNLEQSYDSVKRVKEVADIVLASHGSGEGDGLIGKVFG
ncbi:MAG: N-acyl homoserine lactonase family protein [Gudongella sp.]|nr:N-acyl homoserine lactonase family protein [Gudongella sp.]